MTGGIWNVYDRLIFSIGLVKQESDAHANLIIILLPRCAETAKMPANEEQGSEAEHDPNHVPHRSAYRIHRSFGLVIREAFEAMNAKRIGREANIGCSAP